MYILTEIFLIICTTLGINYVTFGKIASLNRPTYIKIFYWAISIIVVPLLMIQALNSLSEEYLGVKFDLRYCTLLGNCPEMANGKSDFPSKGRRPEVDVPTADIVQVCKLGLNATYDDWSVAFEFQPYVAEVKRRRKSIDDCRLVLGLPTMEAQTRERERLAEENRIRNLDEVWLCSEAIDEGSREWDLSDAAREAVREARNRRYTKDGCLLALGRTTPSEVQIPQTGSSGLDAPAPEFPTGYVRNPKSNVTNLREGPGKSSRILMKLANGTEVVLLGTKPSPTSGHAYCRVLTAGGVPGYVDHELVDGNCTLSPAQANYLIEIERKERMEAFSLFKDLAILGLGIALRRQ